MNSTETVLPVTTTIDAGLAMLSFGPFVLQVQPEGDNYHVAAYRASDLAEHDPGDDWPAPLWSHELIAG